MVFFFLFFFFLLLFLVAFLVLLERNMLGLSQLRKSPNITGLYSVFQTFSDALKLLTKKFLFFSFMRKVFFLTAPLLGFFLSSSHWFFFFFGFQYYNSGFSLLISLLIGSVLVYSIIFASWSSNNSYSIISTLRGVAQMISYEVVFGFFFFFFFLGYGSYSWSIFFFHNLSFFNMIFLILPPIWITIMLAELNRTPFDLIEGESELVGGFNVEFSSSSFTLLFLSEYLNIWFMACVTTIFFMYMNFFLSFFLVIGGVFFIIWARVQLPRYKYFDLISLSWKVLLPVISSLLFVFIFFSFFM